MDIEISDSYSDISQKAKSIIVEQIREKPDLLLCAATGSSPAQTYQLLEGEFHMHPEWFSKLRIVKLDEWCGIPKGDRGTCEFYLQTHLIRPLKISSDRYFGFDSDPADPYQECKRIEGRLHLEGPVDLCVLGLGMNGHLALNEPSEFLSLEPHVVKLANTTRDHLMIREMIKKPSLGLTLGMGDILNSKMILILIHGEQKKEIIKQFLSKKVTSFLPASFLWLHNNVTCLIDNKGYFKSKVNPAQPKE
jgi:galactosamine-6-phosphate isomerase